MSEGCGTLDRMTHAKSYLQTTTQCTRIISIGNNFQKRLYIRSCLNSASAYLFRPTLEASDILALIGGILGSLEDLIPCVFAPDGELRWKDIIFGYLALVDFYGIIELVRMAA